MQRMRRAFLILCAPLLAASALHAAKPPKWVNGLDPAYPDKQYLTGVGVGGDLDGARANARAEISKVFQAKVEQTATDKQTESSSVLGKRRSAALGTQESAMKTTVSTESLLEGVVIAQTWQDLKAKKYYALAVLDKPKTRQALSTQITDKEEAISTQLSLAKSAGTPLERARAYNSALLLAQERDALAARRRVVDPAAIPDLNIGTNSAEIRRDLEQALAKIQFIVLADGGEGSRLKETVTGKINEMGFKVLPTENVVSSPDNPILKIKCALALEKFDRGNPNWKFFLWKGKFEMADDKDQTLASSAPTGSDGHLLEDAARTKTRETGEAALAQEAQAQISKYIFGE